jgi:hypothetical protein
VIETAGSPVYPAPPEVTVMVVTKTAVRVATAVAGSPAFRRPQQWANTVATCESHRQSLRPPDRQLERLVLL